MSTSTPACRCVHTCLSTCACTDVCVCVCARTDMCTRTHARALARPCTLVHSHGCPCERVPVHKRFCGHMCAGTSAYACMHGEGGIVCTCVCKLVCTCAHVNAHMHGRGCMYVCGYTDTCADTQICVQTHVHTQVRAGAARRVLVQGGVSVSRWVLGCTPGSVRWGVSWGCIGRAVPPERERPCPPCLAQPTAEGGRCRECEHRKDPNVCRRRAVSVQACACARAQGLRAGGVVLAQLQAASAPPDTPPTSLGWGDTPLAAHQPCPPTRRQMKT